MDKYYKIFFTAAVFVLVFGGAALLLSFSYSRSVSAVEDQIFGQLDTEARYIEQDVYHITEKMIINELVFLATSDEIIDYDAKRAQRILDLSFNRVKELYVNDAAILGANGVLLTNATAPEIIGTDFSFRDYFNKAKAQKELKPAYEFITFRGTDAGQKGVIIAMPVLGKNSQFKGVVLYTIKINELFKFFDISDVSVENIWAADSEGTILYHRNYDIGTKAEDIFSGDEGSGAFLDKIKKGETYRGKYVRKDGSRRLARSFIVNIGEKSFNVVISRPEETAVAYMFSMLKNQLLYAFVGVVIIMSLSFFAISYAIRKSVALEKEIARQKESANKSLTEANEKLENEINERKKANEMLEEKLKELEKINKMMVGRELKMAEMKKEIEKMKSD